MESAADWFFCLASALLEAEFIRPKVGPRRALSARGACGAPRESELCVLSTETSGRCFYALGPGFLADICSSFCARGACELTRLDYYNSILFGAAETSRGLSDSPAAALFILLIASLAASLAAASATCCYMRLFPAPKMLTRDSALLWSSDLHSATIFYIFYSDS